MNVLMMTLLYPDECYQDVAANSRNGMQNQIDSYQKAFWQGISCCLTETETLQAVNALPVGVFPVHYRKWLLPRTTYQGGSISEIGGINLPLIKQKMRQRRARKALLAWAKASPENRTVVVYTLYLPYLKAIAEVKRSVPDLRAAVIVTDLPNQYGLSSGRKGLLKRIEERMGEEQLAICKKMDGFVLLTEQMAEVLPCQNKKTIVIEGLIREDGAGVPAQEAAPFEVLYTGTLSPELGIGELLEAFSAMPDVRLRICGGGVMHKEVQAFADKHANIIFEGFVPHEKALALQAQAGALINPRSPEGLFTRYSFPSKTLEYMRSGKPVICYRLEGIPADYDPYLHYIPAPGAEGIRQAVEALRSMSPAERSRMGEVARDYVLANKNPAAQCKKLVAWLRSL